jgi:dihydrofolate reductase
MSQILLNLTISLDGFIEGPKGEFDWCFTDQDYGMTAFLARCDGVILGRKSYELLLQFDPNPYPDKIKYVFSNSNLTVADNTVVVNGNLVDKIAQIRQETQGDLWFFGGASLLEDFLKHDLIDEMYLAVHPLTLGSGKPLFPHAEQRKWFQLKGVETYSSGLVQLIYGRKTS